MILMAQTGVLFDMDGVLVDSEPVITAAAVEGLRRLGIPAQYEDFKPFTGMGEDRFIGGVAEKYGQQYRLEMKDLVYGLYCERVDEALTVYPGTRPTLERLHAAGVPMALASSADLIKVRANLRVAGIPFDMFGIVLAGNDVTRKKPFPDIYMRAAQGLGLDARDCIVVEDAISGIQAACAAGARSIAITTSFERQALADAGATWVVDSIDAIADIILNV